MDNGLKVRQILFESLLEDGDNRENWEKLCCSNRPLVPFLGAGISAWCYPTWNNLLKEIVEKVYSPQCAEKVQEALDCKTVPKFGPQLQKTFRWMEEIAECIFETCEKDYKKYMEIFRQGDNQNQKGADLILHQLRLYVGKEAENKKVDAVKELYEAFSEKRLKEKGKIPEYQNLFFRLFPDVLVTTNYDKALESCYNSILSYSYKDLAKNKKEKDKKEKDKKSWLFQAIEGKLHARQMILDGKENYRPDVTIPGMPMLLKVHGSIEQANDIALSWSGYEKAYHGEMPKLFHTIVNKSTMIFMGCGMRDDRILGELANKDVNESDLYAFLPKWENDKKKEQEQKELLDRYSIRPIYYDKSLVPKGIQGEDGIHDFFLGLLLENLDRRRIFYPRALEELWDEDRFDKEDFSSIKTSDAEGKPKKQELQIAKLSEKSRKEWLQGGYPQYIHREQAQQIWDLLNSSECPLIAITGQVGAGKTFLCRSIQRLHKSYRDTMQFFYISMDGCRSWEEFGLRLYEGLNIMEVDIPSEQKWMTLAECVSERCGVYWRSVLILDQMEKIQEESGELWETIRKLLHYWKENHTRVIFVCRSYPEKISCHTWQIEHLQKDEAYRVFQSACQAMRNKEISSQEREVVSTLFDRKMFQASEVNLLGKYADSKSNLSSFLEEWDLYYRHGDEVSQTLARMLWNNLLSEHCYADKLPEQQEKIKKNILWVWGIMEQYPGNVPHQFFDSYFKDQGDDREKQLSERTLMYMKNYGLCEEVTDEQQSNILSNMIICVEENFVSELEEDQKTEFYEFKNRRYTHGEGMEWFRGYCMNSYEKGLRDAIVQELRTAGEATGAYEQPVNDILELLRNLGRQVVNSDERIQNAELDVILHYEVKSIVQILYAHLGDRKLREQILEISCYFYSYYHYIPNYAASFVRQLITVMEDMEGYSKIYIANMCKVMGDIRRLQGKRDEAIQCYEKALRLCDHLILSEFARDQKSYRAILHIKAGILLARNYYSSDRDDTEDTDEAEKIYKRMEDKPGQAYFNQRIAETCLEEYGTKRRKEQVDAEDSVKIFNEIKIFFLNALRLYKEIEDDGKENTRIAYMLKCIGDLIVEFKEDIWANGNNVQYDFDGRELEIVPQDQKDCPKVGKEWFRAASDYYLKAFICYCCHINWRGLANVLQAMGTCLRATNKDEIKAGSKKVESIYSLAEECYRWLGDVRGLADTLDYFGHYYNDIIGGNQTENMDKPIVTKENVVYKYMALGKWKESRKLWDQQENGDKVSAVEGYKVLLENKINAYLKGKSSAKTADLQVNESKETQQEDGAEDGI